MKNKLLIFTIVSILAFLIAYLILPDKQHDSHSGQHAEVIADHDTLTAHSVDYRRIIDSLSIDKYRLDSANKSLLKGQAEYKQQLNANAAEMKSMAAQLKAANKDSTLNTKIDSLIALIVNYEFLLTQYQAYADSINNVNDSLKINYDAQLKEKDKRISELQAAYDNLFKAYQELFADSRGLMKDLKRQKLKTKIVAVLAGAAAILGLIK